MGGRIAARVAIAPTMVGLPLAQAGEALLSSRGELADRPSLANLTQIKEAPHRSIDKGIVLVDRPAHEIAEDMPRCALGSLTLACGC